METLDGPDAERLRANFSREGALQCGFCTPGMLMTGYDLVRQRQQLTRDEVCVALSGNICRCTGYNGIVRAVEKSIDEGIAAEASDASASSTGELSGQQA
ncbi:(2Fe-2S)-binding protein [Streptomyces sp. NPDC004096]